MSPLGLPPSRPRDGANGLRSLADLADIDARVEYDLAHGLFSHEVSAPDRLRLWADLLDNVEWSPPTAPLITMRGTFGLLAMECRIPRGTPAFTAYLDRGWGLAAAVANGGTGVTA